MSNINSISVTPNNITLEKGRWYRDASVEILPVEALFCYIIKFLTE